jgi:penicillin-binding protein 1C
LADLPFEVVDPSGRSYVPGNLSQTFLGPMSARHALGNSRNIPALRLLSDVVGVDRALTFFDDVGVQGVSFEPGRYGLGLALGNLHVTAEELARAYLVLRHGGRVVPVVTSALDRPHKTKEPNDDDIVTSNDDDIVTSDDDVIDDVTNDDVTNDDVTSGPSRLLSKGAAELVTNILADPTARRPSFPEGSALDHELAVATKTGTSQGFRDGWTVAYSDRLLIVVWIGTHEWRRMNHLGGLAGTADAVKELIDTLQPRHRRHVPLAQSFPDPIGSERIEVCAHSGQLAHDACPHRRSELFLPATAPTTHCSWHRRIDIDVRTGDLATPTCPKDVVRRIVAVDLPPAYARFVRQQGWTPLPARFSRLCGGGAGSPATVTLLEPRDGTRYIFDPDTAAEHATVFLRAEVEGDAISNDLVFLVDGEAVALVGEPHEARWSLTPGRHTIQAVLAHGAVSSPPVTILVR